MPFSEVDRVVYAKNPLVNVICQLRFPPILAIDAEVPSDFQKAIIEDYPLYEEKTEIQQEFSAEINVKLPEKISNPISKVTTNKNHTFTSVDGVWTINLTRTFLSISTTKYNRWEEFLEKFEKPLIALRAVYTPPFFTRIGLRYIDVFCRTELGLEAVNWCDIIKPQYLGVLSSDFMDSINEYNSKVELKLIDGVSNVRIITGLMKNQDNEKCFLVDSDFYTAEKVLGENIESKLDFLHVRSTRLIRDIIKDKLHKAMEPTSI